MKKIRYIFSIFCFAIAWTGCDSMLDVTPETDFTDPDFWKSEAELKGACTRLYRQFQTNSYTSVATPAQFLRDHRGDDQENKSNATADAISNGTWSIPVESDDWTLPYRYIFTANNIVEKAAKSPVSESIRNKYIGEARFFRAWYYFDLVSKYGDVPLVTERFISTVDPRLKMPRTPREEVIQQCYEDLEFAALWLPNRTALPAGTGVQEQLDRCRVTRSSALALMVRIALHEGTMLKCHNLASDAIWKAHLQKSIDAFNLLKAEGHRLYTTGGSSVSYLALFIDENSMDFRNEALFVKAYGPNGIIGGTTNNHNYSSICATELGVMRSMIDYYLYADGLPREKSPLVVTPETSFNTVLGFETDGVTPVSQALGGRMGERDPRLPMTIMKFNDPNNASPNVLIAGVQVQFQLMNMGGAYSPFNASWSPGYMTKKGFVGSRPGSDYTDRIFIRWGEMLISYAEALYELNGSITDAQLDETVNTLRDRVGFGARLTNAFVSANGLEMREEIRRERTVELMVENRRYPDIIRWKIAEKVLPKAKAGGKFTTFEAFNGPGQFADANFYQSHTDSEGKINGVQEYAWPEKDIRIIQKASERFFDPQKDYYYPIPSFEISQSDGNIIQNPGWH